VAIPLQNVKIGKTSKRAKRNAAAITAMELETEKHRKLEAEAATDVDEEEILIDCASAQALSSLDGSNNFHPMVEIDEVLSKLSEDTDIRGQDSGGHVQHTAVHGPRTTSFSGPTSDMPGLQEREEIARAAFKLWFRIKKGNKEIKDHWWALYYRKVIPKYHLRDNLLGRLINTWIEEELNPGGPPILDNSANADYELDSADASQDTKEKQRRRRLDGNFDERTTPHKKRKPNSAKEGTIPAYLNVELVNPNLDDPNCAQYIQNLKVGCVDGNIIWEKESLDKDVQWFRENRNQIMESVPSLSARKLKSKRMTTGSQNSKIKGDPSSNFVAVSPIKLQREHLNSRIHFGEGSDWIRAEFQQLDEFYLAKLEMPGLLPEQDFIVQTDEKRLIVKGVHKLKEDDNPADRTVAVEIELPKDADMGQSEQTFGNGGILCLKIPMQKKHWRTLGVNLVTNGENWT